MAPRGRAHPKLKPLKGCKFKIHAGSGGVQAHARKVSTCGRLVLSAMFQGGEEEQATWSDTETSACIMRELTGQS